MYQLINGRNTYNLEDQGEKLMIAERESGFLRWKCEEMKKTERNHC